MTNKEMSTESVSLENERMLKYKMFSVGFSYPDENFFNFFPEVSFQKEEIISEYDRLFHTGKVWLYASEYLIDNEFQRVSNLSDIMGFYKAFALEPNNERPDHISAELEFMYLLIFKTVNADTKEKKEICIDAQKKFFNTHLFPGAQKISEVIIGKEKNNFYATSSKELIEFLKTEKTKLK